MPRMHKIRSGSDDQTRSVGTRLPSWVRSMVVVIVGEFLGTFLFLFLAYVATQTALNTQAQTDVPNQDGEAEGRGSSPLLPLSFLYIAAAFGASLAINVWVFYRVSGGMFNPAVTLGLLLVGVIRPHSAAMIIPTQIVAAIAAAAVVDGIIPGPLSVNNRLNNDTSIVQGFFLEMFLTSQLVLTVYFLAVEKHRATFLAPIGVGISAFIAHLAGTPYTGTSINPVRSFGPDVITGFVGYHWIFWVAPCLGSVLAFGVYKLMKWMDYEDVNGGQDATDVEAAREDQADY